MFFLVTASQGGFQYLVESMTPDDLDWYIKRMDEQQKLERKALKK